MLLKLQRTSSPDVGNEAFATSKGTFSRGKENMYRSHDVLSFEYMNVASYRNVTKGTQWNLNSFVTYFITKEYSNDSKFKNKILTN